MATNNDATYNGKTVHGRTVLTDGESEAVMRVTFLTEVDNPDALPVGYPDPSVVASAINAYAAQQGWPTLTFTVEQPAAVDVVGASELIARLGIEEA